MRLLKTIFAIMSGMWLGCSGTPAQADAATTAHSFSFLGMDGEILPLAQFKGKLLLVVNTASQCGFTGQYEGLEQLYQHYKDRGLVIVGVPCNDFGGQEPGGNAEIATFAAQKYHVTFPLVQKEAVSGGRIHPFYDWAAREAGPLGAPKWNFHKYLIGANGQMIDWFASTTSPTSGALVKAIEANMPIPAAN